VYTLPCFHLLALERNKGIFDQFFKSLANDHLDIVGGYDVDDQMFEDDEKVGLIIKHGHHDLFLKQVYSKFVNLQLHGKINVICSNLHVCCM